MTTEEYLSTEPDATCEAIKNDGNRCGNAAMHGSRFCFFHDPAKQTERRGRLPSSVSSSRTAC